MTRLLAALVGIAVLFHPFPAAAIGGPGNIVMAVNQSDGRLVVRGNVQLVREPGMIAAPQNLALAKASCTDCQTIAVALQLNFANADARYIAPQNAATAINDGCTRCTTLALAYQVFLTVDDPTQTPDGVAQVMRDFDAEVRAVSADPTITFEAAEMRIVDIIGRFMPYATSFDVQRSASQ
jgi:hypothetical protein